MIDYQVESARNSSESRLPPTIAGFDHRMLGTCEDVDLDKFCKKVGKGRQ